MAKLAAIMSWFHLVFGLLMFFAFVTTGKYMRVDFPDKDLISPELRILMRSRHIYILFSSLIHLGLGIYLQMRPHILRQAFQYLGSTLLVISSVLLVWAFVEESYQLQHFSNISRYGLYTSLAGIISHVIGGLDLDLRRITSKNDDE